MGSNKLISQPSGEAIQIIKIKPEGCLRKHFHLDMAALSGILSGIGDMPVAVFTVAGRARCGKSFTANYMLRYLANNSIGNQFNDDWMGSDKKDVPLTGFTWRSGDPFSTHGLYMWSKPFVMKDKDGNKLAVLVMDTQGIFDNETPEEDWVAIMGIAAMTSSCLIYNVRGDLSSDDIKFMNKFMTFSNEANSEIVGHGEEKLLQKLAILVRSYQPTTNKFEYTCQYGNELIEKQLKTTEKMAQEHRDCRDRLRNWTGNIRGYVLPSPNKDMLADTYDGNWREMDPEFAEALKSIVNDLFRKEHLEPKKHDNVIGKDGLRELFRIFVEIFNADNRPGPSLVANAVIYSEFQRVTVKLNAVYRKLVNNTTGSEAATHWKRVCIARTASSTAGLAASLTAVGVAFAPLTAGASLALTILAGILAGGSLTTAAGAGIGNYVRSKEFKKEITELLAKWKKINEEFVSCSWKILDDPKLATKVKNLPSGFRVDDLSLVKPAHNGQHNGSKAKGGTHDAAQTLFQGAVGSSITAGRIATGLMDDIAIPFGKVVAGTAPKVLAVAGLAFAPIDFGFLINDWLTDHPSEKVIEEKLKELKRFEDNVRNIDRVIQHVLLNKPLPDRPY